MSLTQRFKVTFEFTHVSDAAELVGIDDLVLESARFISGKTTKNQNGFTKPQSEAIVLAALNGGTEGVHALLIKWSMREFIRCEIKDDGFKVGPATVRVVRGGKQ